MKLSGESVGDAGDQYTGLDRFGRIVDQRWRNGGTDVDRFTYTYERDSNRLTKTNALNSALNEVYTYDGLNQVASFNRGSGTRTQSWDYDALGNMESVTTNSVAQTRTHNRQNEITAVGGATSPTFDANGNMTTDETGKQFVYDAWNRLVTVKNSGGTTIKTYGYDGLYRRVSETASGTTTDLYYSAGWQVLEEQVGGTTKASYVWSPVYVDAMIARDRDTDGNGSLDERLYPTHDANFNVAALVNTGGAVVERYVYDSFGAMTVLNTSWSVLSGSAYIWPYFHQGGKLDSVSGLYHFRIRDYSPFLGRWATMDPVLFSAGDPNLYRALGNNSLIHLDPQGLDYDPWNSAWWDRTGQRAGGALQIVGGGALIVTGFVVGGGSQNPFGLIGGVILATVGVDLAVHGWDNVWDPRNAGPSPTWGNQATVNLTGYQDAGHCVEGLEGALAIRYSTSLNRPLVASSTPLARGERLTEYYSRLRGQPGSRSADEALGRVSRTLDEVEDALSGIPRRNPPPPPNMPDGRMYPPQADNIVRHLDGSITARTRGHDISIGRDGSITMTNRQTGQVDFQQPGAGN